MVAKKFEVSTRPASRSDGKRTKVPEVKKLFFDSAQDDPTLIVWYGVTLSGVEG